ncbi:suppressor of SWI4 1 homolog [Mya arenaria]|uniref:suppressor of SWI4 1 homolog n=1 Tax=Mya arenaria TaxID=6604 RepID=UPI0022E63CB9|nr:suppressor of SWI4 1 homolog [Mya arenaria]
MARKKKGKKKKSCPTDINEDQYKAAPHSFVFHRGHVGRNVRQLVADTRTVMEPFTAKNLQVRKKNVLKDFVSVAGMLHVSHFIMYTKTEMGVYVRMCRLPRGPTLTFKAHDYCLTKDVISSLRKPNLEQMQFLNHPLVVLNNFTGAENHIKLMASMFQNLFPSINIHKVNLNDVKRCVMFNYEPESGMIDFRHYNIRVVPVGMSRGVKKLIQAKVPNLAKYGDISEYMTRAGYSSESEVELDGPMNEVVLPQNIKSRGNIKSAKSAVRLTELGPRLSLQLVKIEEGICNGQVMFHSFLTKTDVELAQIKAQKEKKQKQKEARRRQQEVNVARKQTEREDNKQRSLEGIRRKLEEEGEAGIEQPETKAPMDDDDDVEYYKAAVGHLPDEDTFVPGGAKRKKQQSLDRNVKLTKFDKKPKTDKLEQGKKPKPDKFGKANITSKQEQGGKKFNKKASDRKEQTGKGKGDGSQSKRAEMTPLQRMEERKKKKKKLKEKKMTKKLKGSKKKVK